MTSTIQAPPPAAAGPAPSAPGPSGEPRSRKWLFGFWAVVFVLLLAVSPGRQTFDTKLGVTTDPGRFLADFGDLWHDEAGFGGILNQYVGYAFPMLPFHGLGRLLHIPVWLTERLWLSLIVTAAFWGAVRLAERLGFGTSTTRLLGGAVYALWPTFTIVVGSTSAAALPGAVLPWVLLPLTNENRSARVAALRSALIIPFMGGVNAASTLASLLPVGLYLLSRPAGPRRRKLLAWWIPGVLLATTWWIVPLLMLGIYGENFMPYVETSATTTGTMSATETLRGAGNWVAYLHFGEAWLPAGWTVVSSVFVVVGTAVVAGLGLAGLARRDLPERRWLVLVVLSVALVTLAGYGGALGAPFHSTVQDLLNGALVPFRNIYKFQPGLALALALGLTHLLAVAFESRQAARLPNRRLAPLAATVLVLPALALPYVNGSILQPGSFKELPAYWKSTADYLQAQSPDSRALVVPATAHGIYTWGSPIDQPLDVLGRSPWAQRDYVPFGNPGNRRAMDAVEQALMTGGEVPGLADYLGRAGLHYVVVRNDLDPDQLGHVPTTTVKRTLAQSGFQRVKGFGPITTGGRIAEDTPLQVEGLFPRQRAVEIYAPADSAVEQPGRAELRAVSDTAVVSGGPESLLQLSADPAMRDRPAVLTGDEHPGVDKPAVQVNADGLRRADTRFGLVNSNTSYTYTPTERNAPEALQDPGDKPKQILPREGTSHQTVAEIEGAKAVTASSSGNWLFHLPQYDPVNAFDGNPDTAWAEGSAGSPEGEWLKAEFDDSTDIPSSFAVTPLPQQGVRSAPTQVRVETEQGSVTSSLQPDGSKQSLAAAPGKSRWIKLTILDAQAAHSGLTGAGFSEISIPDVKMTRLLRLPTDGKSAGADSEVVSLHRTADPGGLSPAGTEPGLHRTFSTSESRPYRVDAQAVPVPGDALDKLLYEVAPEQRRRVVASADSTSRLNPDISARNLTDGDLATAWIAGDRPVVHLKWPDKKKIDAIVLPAAGGLSTRPEEVQINTPTGALIASVDENGWVRFPAVTTNQLDITITRTAPLTVHNPVADEDLQLPVGLSEVYVPALEDYRTPTPKASRTFALPCGEGPPLAIDDQLHATSARGAVRDLVERRPIEVTLCQENKENAELPMDAGKHRVQTAGTGPLAVSDLTFTHGGGEAAASAARPLKVLDGGGDDRTMRVGAGEATYLTTFENHNKGWTATLNGKKLESLRLDGWQQGFLVPAGAGGTVELHYEPADTYRAGLIGGAAGVVLLAALVLWRRKAENPDEPSAAPAGPGLILGTVALTLVGVVIAGPLALIVPVLAVLARWRHELLVPLALGSMVIAGAVAATGAGESPAAEEGAFGPVAQLFALIALFAALVSVRRGDESGQAHGSHGGGGNDTLELPQQSGGAHAAPRGRRREGPEQAPELPRRSGWTSGPTLSARERTAERAPEAPRQEGEPG
ncbi:DUF3367 domain-containing protein [Streptomyces sp. NA04227]|uniref:alpha-(1->3)-arabinofuranosyltransferase n=1 Tax=Streptomyces sp. NA04227 TaxID=2742136 RepID=UPI001591F243|nr:alpha-(1->3)-arabinofuranosyltransferase [Streptomyces sp. NA04227]QKW05266.1 DUF3367 domain-containing protein [Streptomyces sp. NA04227]